MKKINKKDFVTSEDPTSMTPDEMLATLRNLQELTQSDLSKMTGMTQANISHVQEEAA